MANVAPLGKAFAPELAPFLEQEIGTLNLPACLYLKGFPLLLQRQHKRWAASGDLAVKVAVRCSPAVLPPIWKPGLYFPCPYESGSEWLKSCLGHINVREASHSFPLGLSSPTRRPVTSQGCRNNGNKRMDMKCWRLESAIEMLTISSQCPCLPERLGKGISLVPPPS